MKKLLIGLLTLASFTAIAKDVSIDRGRLAIACEKEFDTGTAKNHLCFAMNLDGNVGTIDAFCSKNSSESLLLLNLPSKERKLFKIETKNCEEIVEVLRADNSDLIQIKVKNDQIIDFKVVTNH